MLIKFCFIADSVVEELCTMEDGKDGTCEKIENCNYRIREILEGRRKSPTSGRCRMEKSTEIVCCPKEGLPPNSGIFQTKICFENSA